MRSQSTGSIRTVPDVEKLLERPAPPFDLLLDAMAVCRGARNWQLLDHCVYTALTSVTGEVPHWQWRPVVLEAAANLLRHTKIDELEERSREAASILRRRRADLPQRVGGEIEDLAHRLDQLAVTLADGSPASLVSGCALLRKVDRPDLGRILATRALQIEPRSGPAHTTRAAAALDEGKVSDAMSDLRWLETNVPSPYASNVRSRAELAQRHIKAAMYWAREANRQDPDGVAGMLSLAAAAKLGDEPRIMAWAISQLEKMGRSTGSPNWDLFVAAKAMLQAGNRDTALQELRKLTDDGYQPARRYLLEIGAEEDPPSDEAPF